ncbi:hypothetical protein [Streptomyces sp. TR02-1]|uniref:hypothetical protein n=1 Tax=Streptomyces sp. TR02-1 TaxID=3385977 RepID=UPI0039A15FAA
MSTDAVYRIGDDSWRPSDLARPGTAVIRPAVLHRRRDSDRAITSTPCCGTVRHIPARFLTLESGDLPGWPEQCPGCRWHYRLEPVQTRPGGMDTLYGVKWTSQGY